MSHMPMKKMQLSDIEVLDLKSVSTLNLFMINEYVIHCFMKERGETIKRKRLQYLNHKLTSELFFRLEQRKKA